MAEAGKYTLAVFEETGTFGVKDAGFDAGKEKFRARNSAGENRAAAIADESVRLDEAGELREIQGVIWEEGALSFDSYAESTGVSAGDGVAQVKNWQAKLLSSLTGEAPTSDTGDSVNDAGATATGFQITTPGRLSDGGFVGHLQNGRVEWRPIISEAAGLLGLGMALPVAPADTDELFASTFGQFLEYAAYPLQFDRLGNDASEHNEYFGCVPSSFSIPEVESGQVMNQSWAFRVANGVHQGAGVRETPTGKRPTVLAGGDVLIGAYGSTVYDTPKFARPGIEIARSYEGVEDPNFSTSAKIGICGWEALSDTTIRLGLSVPMSSVPPAALGAASWQELYDQDTDEFVHVFIRYGFATGRTALYYFPKLQLQTRPVAIEVRRQSAWRLDFAPPEGMTERKFRWGLG